MIYEILNEFGDVENTVVADEDFMRANYAGRYRFKSEDPSLVLIYENPPELSKIAMISRFTDDEYLGILSAAKTDVQVEAWLDKFRATTRIDLTDPRTKAGLGMMVHKNLITEDRASTILTEPVKDEEK